MVKLGTVYTLCGGARYAISLKGTRALHMTNSTTPKTVIDNQDSSSRTTLFLSKTHEWLLQEAVFVGNQTPLLSWPLLVFPQMS